MTRLFFTDGKWRHKSVHCCSRATQLSRGRAGPEPSTHALNSPLTDLLGYARVQRAHRRSASVCLHPWSSEQFTHQRVRRVSKFLEMLPGSARLVPLADVFLGVKYLKSHRAGERAHLCPAGVRRNASEGCVHSHHPVLCPAAMAWPS